MRQVNEKRRWLALLLALCLIAFFGLSGAYFLANAHHTCTGEHCPICERMGILLALTAELGTIAIVLFLPWAYGVPVAASGIAASTRHSHATPIGRFDRMNN